MNAISTAQAMGPIFQFDASILLWIQANLRSSLGDLFIFITHLGDKGILWIVLSLAMLYPRKTRRTGVTCVVAMVIGLIVANLILKNWIARVRPYELVEGLQLMIEKQHDFSFPSGHATNSLACAWVIFRTQKRAFGVSALILALLICFSRLYVGVHYPTDVLAGIAIGIASAEAAIAIVSALRKKYPKFRRFIRAK